MERFDIPIVLFIFKRSSKSVEIIERIRNIQPKRLYVIADYGRNSEECLLADECRKNVEDAIDWPCEIIKNYAEYNRGVFNQIGLGALWVFEREEYAIFLEDDNLPELTFFKFCKEMLYKYRDNDRILWVCGTNYLGKYTPKNDVSYVFSKHMLPCGWASWSYKFTKYYDGYLKLLEDDYIKNRIIKEYESNSLYNVYAPNWYRDKKRIMNGLNPHSWDYQMSLTLRANGLLGIVPINNQIKNIGVDNYSEHGGNSMSLIMTKRFCGMDSYSIDFPLKHPKAVLVDLEFEKKIREIITPPLRLRVKGKIVLIIKKMINIDEDIKLSEAFLTRRKKKNNR